ncbi:MAG: gliding motility-associated C-terminal domain-containing protein [Bacteroidetes bacterium]|nr:gliding motility-associated C-terminal domain-containing protein [Bacteroidota bacterium]
MKIVLRSFLVAIISLFSAYSSQASHVAAADIYYEYLSPLTYKVHLVLYRDCKITASGGQANATLGPNAQMSATSASCGQNINFTATGTGGIILGDLCPNINNWCVDFNSIFPGYEEWHYTYDITLPMACTDWRFNYELCCRNTAIDNLTGPGGQSLCVSAGLNNIARPANNSVVLSIKPIPYVCVNQPKTYLNGPLDPDYDSLLFLPTQPLGQGNCGPITWAGAGVNTLNPFGASAPGGYVVNPNTGTAVFTPTVQNTYVIAFTCYEIDPITFDTVGFVMRDVQLNVVNCNAAPPSDPNGTQCYNLINLTGATLAPPVPPSTCPDVIETCPGTTISFDVKSISNSLSNLVITYANNVASCPGSTYTSNPIGGGNPVTGTFTWTPNGTQIGNHTLIITFMDSTCTTAQPIVLKSYAVILIKVLPGVDAGPDLLYCIGADSIQMNVTAPPAITQWQWTDLAGNTSNIGLSSTTIQNPKAAPTVTTTYIVTAVNPPAGLICKTKDTVTITLVPGQVNVSAGGPSTICVNDSINLGATATPPQANPTITWTPNYNLSSTTILTPWASPLGTTNYQLVFRDDNGCTYTDYHLVNVDGARPLVNAAVSVNPVCPNAPFQLFSNTSSMPCGLSLFPCNSPIPELKTVGTQNIQQSLYSPYYTNYQDGYRTQMIFTSTELAQSGIKPGNIKSIAWYVVGKGSDTMRNVRISMGCTSDTAFNGSTGFISGLSQVFFTPKFYSAQGWNTHTFTNSYFWDGMTNLVVQICYDVDNQSSSTNTDILTSSNTNYNQVIHQNAYSATGCTMNATSPLIGAVRPNTRFAVCDVGAFTYNWTPVSTLNDNTLSDPNSTGISNTTDFVVTVTASSNTNCVTKDTIQVMVDNSNSVTATATPQVLCGPGLTTLSATTAGTAPQYYCGEENVPCSSPFNVYTSGVSIGSSLAVTPFNGNYAGARTQMLFTVAELNAMGITKGRIDSFAFNIITKTSFSTFNMNIRMGCTQQTALNGFIPSFELKDVYSNLAYQTYVGWNMFVLNSPYLWDGVNNLVIEVCFYNGQFNTILPDAVDYSTTAAAQFYMQGSDYGGCEIPSVQFPSTPIISTARPIVNFYLCDIPVKPWKFRWDPALFVFDSTAATTTAYVNQSGTYYIYSTGGNQCEVIDSVTVTMSVHDVDATPHKDTLCLGDSYQAYAIGKGNAPSETFLWMDQFGGSSGLSCTTCPNPIITPTTAGINYYTLVRTDTYGCTDSITISVLVYALPAVSILNGDSVTIKYGEQVNLIATGGYVYNWTPVWGSNNPNVNSVIVSPGEPTMYTVYSLNELGCRSSDSIFVNIDYTDKLFIPSAFSPNNDGVNDLFKVTNLTFQSIQEFRVMNRWGQEVFSAIDNRGWNGKFKGKDQDPATFYYLIKVAFPDGPVKTYKGDVILVR